MPPGPGCGQQARQPRADQVFPVQLVDPVVACRDPVEGLRAGPRRWRQMAVRLARVIGKAGGDDLAGHRGLAGGEVGELEACGRARATITR
jgi:hypothetical protein